jgi:hypothetical protein
VPCETCGMDTCVCGMYSYVDGFMTNDPDILQVIDHTYDCLMGDEPECNCPASTVRIKL